MPPPLRNGRASRAALLLAPVLLATMAQAQAQSAPMGSAAAATEQLQPGGSPARVVLYTLATQCTRAGGPVVACTVEAVNEGGATYYHHRLGRDIISLRITDDPVTMSRRDGPSGAWRPLQRAGARFSSNTICIDGRDLCVVNPNYLNSVREDRRNERLQGRDLVKLHFGPDGRVDASCYDSGCEVDLR